MTNGRFWKCLGLAVLFAARLAHAQSAAKGSKYSDFERDVARQVLELRGLSIDPRPEGKRIQSIEIVPLDVFDERDPVPDFVNVFHVTSRKYVIRRELLFQKGDVYDPLRIDESARNLRNDIRQLSLVLIVPASGSRPDRVRVLVITKDVWSLRLNWDASASNGKLTNFVLNPSEQNLLGTHTNIGAYFRLRPDTYSLGARFANPRVAGSHIQASIAANVIFNRDTGHSEGSYGYFVYEQPLYSRETKWGFRTAAAWLDETTRSYVGLTPRVFIARPRSFASPDCAADPACARSYASTPVLPELGWHIPYVYLTEREVGESSVVRSFGKLYKYDFSVGVEVDRRHYRTPDLSHYDPRAVSAFIKSELPVNDTRISPVFQLHAYSSRLKQFLDFETLGLQEDYNIGHELFWRVYPASRDLGSSRTMLGTHAGLSYTLPLGDGLVRAVSASTIELATEQRDDALLELDVRAVTPHLGLGRLLVDGVLLDRYRNYLNRKFVLGGDTRLRGYPLGAFLGKDVLAVSAEFRSRPVEILSAQTGVALFYDVGDAFDGFDEMKLKQDAGIGLRVLFPQLDRVVFRADWGFPLSPGYKSFPGSLFVTFGQAFTLPALGTPSTVGNFVGNTN